MKITYLLILWLFPILLMGQKNSVLIDDIVSKTMEKVKAIHTIEYEIEYKFKEMGRLDTSLQKSFCFFEKNIKDSLFFRSFYVQLENTSYLYLGDSLFKKEKKSSLIVSQEKREIDHFDFVDHFLDDWLIFELIQEAFIHKVNKKYLGKKNVQNQECHVIAYSTYNREDESLIVMTIYINTNSYLPIKSIITFEHMGLVQFTEKTISSYRINKKQIYFSAFFEGIDSIDNVPNYLEDYPTNKIQKSLLFESAYNKLGILRTIDDINIDTLDLKNKVVLIDFWYMGCPPCLKAIPIIKEIQSSYKKEDFIVIGINPFDARSKELLKSFIKKNDMNYPLILDKGELSKNFNTQSYPTFIILDQKGIIQFEQKGYSKNLYLTLKTKIDSILKK